MTPRPEVYDSIRKERQQQLETLSDPGRQSLAAYLTYMSHETTRAVRGLVTGMPEATILPHMRKIAAFGFGCMEIHGYTVDPDLILGPPVPGPVKFDELIEVVGNAASLSLEVYPFDDPLLSRDLFGSVTSIRAALTEADAEYRMSEVYAVQANILDAVQIAVCCLEHYAMPSRIGHTPGAPEKSPFEGIL